MNPTAWVYRAPDFPLTTPSAAVVACASDSRTVVTRLGQPFSTGFACPHTNFAILFLFKGTTFEKSFEAELLSGFLVPLVKSVPIHFFRAHF